MGMRVGVSVRLVVVVWAMVLGVVRGGDVTYDGRALIIDGTRRILFSGSIHYPRSTPEMWPSLVGKAKDGGLDVIQTYVFWNVHEPIQGEYNFQGRYDLVKFIKVIRDQGLYVSLRIGPFIESEWKYGGLPFWLHDVPGIVFRCDNEPFKFHMQRFVTMIVNMMKSERLYASQGGPIIMSQIENEYQLVEPAFHEKGPPYVQWAASMVVGLQTGVPWVMCKQNDAPDPVINTCNGLRCGDTFAPNSPTKPSLWTENWTTVYTRVGEEARLRSAQDIAFHTALFIAKNGSFVNYYMYHGGTNFGRSASAYTTTSYYDDAPLDEYGLIRQPKWGHFKELHAAIKLATEPLLWGTHTGFPLGPLQKAQVFQVNPEKCIAFLINNDIRHSATVQFRNVTYQLPRMSISILPDCKNVVYNTAKVSSGYSARSTRTVQYLDRGESWGTFSDEVINIPRASFAKKGLLEHMTTTKDVTDYLWYTVSYNHNSGDDQKVLHVDSRGHAVYAYVNNVLVGSEHGNHDKQGAVLEKPISLKIGQNNISLLSVMVGLPDSGAYMERRAAGIKRVKILDKTNKSLDLTNLLWGYKVGLLGEMLKIYTQEHSNEVKWGTISASTRPPLMWYKTTFDAPSGGDPVALNLSSMGKGEAWINGESIGRYWVSFKTPKGRPAQSLYHIPRSFLRPTGNFLVLFEEGGGDPLGVTIETISSVVTADTVRISRECDFVSESHSSSQPSQHHQQRSIQLQCYGGKNISSIKFASYGNPSGECQKYAVGTCHAAASKAVVEKFCLGKADCSINLCTAEFGADPCPGTPKTLLVVASCN